MDKISWTEIVTNENVLTRNKIHNIGHKTPDNGTWRGGAHPMHGKATPCKAKSW